MHTGRPIVLLPTFIQSVRDSGYRGTANALAELVDNSIEASATQIRIELRSVLQQLGGPDRPALRRVVEVVVADNGGGMDATCLERALSFGGSSRFDSRGGLGRFGMGLPAASVSQCRRVEIYSWQRGGPVLFTCLDVDEVASERMVEIPAPRAVPLPAPYEHLRSGDSGTIVVWKRFDDRLDHEGRHEHLERSLRPLLGRIFRHFILDGGVSIELDGTAVAAIDPLHADPRTGLPGDPLATVDGPFVVEVPLPGGAAGETAPIELRLSLLPEQWQREMGRNATDAKRARELRHLDLTDGVSMVRANREVDLAPNPFAQRHWTAGWYRIEIRFDPRLDELFSVTNNKQQAQIAPGTALFTLIEGRIKAVAVRLRKQIVGRCPAKSIAPSDGAPPRGVAATRRAERPAGQRGGAATSAVERIARPTAVEIDLSSSDAERGFFRIDSRGRLVLDPVHPFALHLMALRQASPQAADLIAMVLAAHGGEADPAWTQRLDAALARVAPIRVPARSDAA